MDLLINAALTAVGILMLCYGGNCLVNGGESIARRMGISSLVVGMTVVAYGTSTPELAASIAAAGDHGDIILGNIVGSNIANIGLVIGVSTLLVTLAMSRKILFREIPIMVGFSVLLVVMSIDGEISQIDGIILISMLGGFTIYIIRQSRRNIHTNTDTEDSKPAYSNARSFGLLGIGVGLLYVGAILTVDNAVAIAEAFNIPEMIIGVTVIAIGTSLPELITSILAIRKGQIDIGVGNIIGSNIYNILMIMGVSATIAGIHVAPVIFQDYAIMIIFSMALFISIKSGKLDYRVGMVLVAGYVIYILSSLIF
ncbi:MAG: calcium/sodium antiporter [Cenarchaeum sp. SB0665_bin_23]|nr:calcium/sodium antiporter [Cenarchaeum sp. SB0667_bin_13]MXY37509.1 calcium/sodium antiporter [Cenarchaeum sp. SB0664_bin_35]MXY60844.1 calcium/sodium antiporter [Cenarchaeum sp. SB0665_bin_23]MXZ93542.1 calcium/sodium antiporter [Cenarchaeum sp. SB0666_bin_15]MYB46610.1 calcium/sodium antiporter [Cenarchaeum sp. SB0662_bin_33]MYC79886.1 calcium/sodium antiporter [Cenarchaeum sp. SB0661_bin_35]MYD58757.1 calcium/sodium antiporter [Cenarchaeum sp. SB0678_bin_8]MYG33338.1 calcium/sodium ant